MGPLGAYGGKLSFEAALDKAGFGLYSYILTSIAGFTVLSYGCIAYGTTVIVPASACELETTTGQQGFLASAPVVGLVLGATIWGYVADVFGRRIPLTISLLAGCTVNALASISVNWIMLMVLQFFATFLASGQFSLAVTLLSESVPMANRNVMVLLVTSIFLFCQGIMAVIAIPIIPLSFSYYVPSLGIYWNSWRTVLVVYSAPSLISAVCLLCMKESPKFLYGKGRETEALEILEYIHRFNHRKSESYGVKAILEDSTQKAGSQTKQSLLTLFKPPLLKTTLIMTCLFVFQQIGAFLVWLPTIANQFFRILETGDGNDLNLCQILDADIDAPPDPDLVPCAINTTALLMVLAVGGIQTTFNVLISLVVNRMGRRNIVICVTAFCGASGLIINLVPNAIGSVILFMVFLTGIIVLGLYTAIVVALFPTSLRAMAVALTSTGGRIANIAAIQVLNLLLASNCNAGFYLFVSIFAASAILALFLADDRLISSVQQPAVQEKREFTKL